jgi:hypothetical protein
MLEEERTLERFNYGGIALPKFSLNRAADFIKRLLPG